MAIKPFSMRDDVAQKTEHWKQEQIDAVEEAKARQRQREQEAERQRETQSQKRNS